MKNYQIKRQVLDFQTVTTDATIAQSLESWECDYKEWYEEDIMKIGYPTFEDFKKVLEEV